MHDRFDTGINTTRIAQDTYQSQNQGYNQQRYLLSQDAQTDSFTKSDKIAIATGTILTLAGILTLILSPKREPSPSLCSRIKGFFTKIKQNRAARKAAKAPVKAAKLQHKQKLKMFKLDFKRAKTAQDIQNIREKYPAEIISKYEYKLYKKELRLSNRP